MSDDKTSVDGEAEDERPSLWDRFPALEKLRFFGHTRRIPYVQQLTSTECGAACLAMVLGYHGKQVRLDELRQLTGAGRDATNALAIIDAARWHGLRGRGLSLEIDDLEYLDQGSILHWEFKHFVVFDRLRKDSVDIIDPAGGPKRVSMEDFGKAFTGVALTFEPTEEFKPSDAGEKVAWHYFRQVISQSGLWVRILLTSLLLQMFTWTLPMLTGAVVDRVIPRADTQLLLVLAAALAVLMLFNFLTLFLRAHLLLYLRTSIDVRMSLGFLDHLVDLPYGFFQVRSSGDLMMRLNSNTLVREMLTGATLSVVLDGILIVLSAGILFVLSPSMALLTTVLAILHVAIMLATRRRRKEISVQVLDRQSRQQSYEVEMLAGMETLKVLGVEQRAVEKWSHFFVDVMNLNIDRGRIDATMDSLFTSLRLASPLVLLAVGASKVLENEINLGSMLGICALAANVLGPLTNLMNVMGQLDRAGTLLDRIVDVLRAEPEQDRSKRRPAHALTGRVSVRNVSFRYGPLSPLVMNDVSLEIEPGQSVAIVGRSGAGKSTLAALLAGMYPPSAGRILFDDVDLAELDLRSVRRQLGVVTQQPYLFSGSIRENIALGRPDAPLGEIMEAARLARIHDDVMAMPMQYETLLMDRGSSLSGGQRQRIAMARALVTGPAVLILDEATSALDAITEAEIQSVLDSLSCTRIVIAHRLSTVARAGLILVMEGGKIVERGRHRDLLATGGYYARLVSAQADAARTPPPVPVGR